MKKGRLRPDIRMGPDVVPPSRRRTGCTMAPGIDAFERYSDGTVAPESAPITSRYLVASASAM